MTKKILVAVVITLVLLAAARRLSKNNPEDLSAAHGGVTVTHTTVFEQVGPGEPELVIGVEPSEGAVAPSEGAGAEIVYRIPGGPAGEVQRIPMRPGDGGSWTGRLPDFGKGKNIEYAFEVRADSATVARLPEEEGRFLRLRYKGEVSTLVLVLHVIFMFGAFFFMVMAALCANDLRKGIGTKKLTVKMVRWLILFTFIGGWPLGFILNRQRFGPVWEGFPFGYDVTDNKTQIMFVFWLMVVLLGWGSFTGRSPETDRFGDKEYSVAVLLASVLSLAIFLIPHSL
ncbi:MAG: hypothetical protein MUF59_10365 [Candidatus Krumholzibacteria bacterium]|nr:hypothetical protein [Candidatus Krumholzibacteria bacterium]